MQSIVQHSAAFFRRLASFVSRVRAWRANRNQRIPFSTPAHLTFPSYSASIHRDVTPNGVRVYSLCGDCGCRLNASATLCDDCAQKRSRPARPY
jgi:hypothetical protein